MKTVNKIKGFSGLPIANAMFLIKNIFPGIVVVLENSLSVIYKVPDHPVIDHIFIDLKELGSDRCTVGISTIN